MILLKDLKELKDVQIGPENTFGFIDNKTAIAREQISGINLVANFQTVNMTATEFFSKINDPKLNQYLYWYGKVNGALVEDVSPHKFIWVSLFDEEHFGMYMWLSSDDVRPPIHYDQDHNFFVHISGK